MNLKKIIKEKDIVMSTRVSSTWATITEIIGKSSKFDYLEFQGEYAPFDTYDLENMARAGELHNLPLIIKVDNANRAIVMQKAVVSGFSGILLTDQRSAEEVRESISYIRADNPENDGSLGYINRRWNRYSGFSSLEDYKNNSKNIVIGVMLEKKAAIDNLEEICAVSGVDFVQFGPADFSMNSGLEHKNNLKELFEVQKKIIEVANKYGVSVRVEIDKASEALPYIDLGVRHFCLGAELRVLQNYLATEVDSLQHQLKKFQSNQL